MSLNYFVGRYKFIYVAMVILSLALSSRQMQAVPVGTLIPAANRIDMVHDPVRNLLYITAGGSVLRYSLASDTFLTPITLGGNLYGIDLSPDANTLVVADETTANGSNWVYVVDVPTLTSHRVYFPLYSLESGTFTVAFGNDGAVLVASSFAGSGWVPLRRLDPATGSFTVIGSVNQNTMLRASGDGSTIGYAESNISSGPVSLYSVSSHTVTKSTGDGWFNYEIAVNKDGTQCAVPTYGGTFIYDGNLNQTGLIGVYAGGQPIGAVYHPSSNAVFFPWAGTTQIQVYETLSRTLLATYDFGSTFSSPGNNAFSAGRMKMSRDGSILFATVSGGVRYFRPNLTIPNYDLNHRLVILGSPANYGVPTPLPYGTNWLQSSPDPVVASQMSATLFTNGGTRLACVGWTGTGSVPASGGGTTVSFTLTNYSTLTWNWVVSDYQLTVATNGTGSVDALSGWYAQGSLVSLTATPGVNYRFDHWTGNVPAGQINVDPLVVTMDQARSLTAVFVLDTFPLVVAGNPGNFGSPVTNPYGTSQILRGTLVTNRVNQVVTNGGTRYYCLGWSGTGDVPASGAGTQAVFTITSSSSLTWNWQLTDYQLTVISTGVGSVDMPGGWYSAGSLIALTATPGVNYRFDHWNGNVPAASTNANPLALTMDQARSVTAVFVPDTLPLVVDGTPGRYGTPTPQGYGTNFLVRNSIVTNRVAQLATNSGARYNCLGWTGTGDVPASGASTQTVFTLTTNSSLVWNWQLTDYQLTVATNGVGSVATPGGWYSAGTLLSLTATPGVNYRFDHWNGNVPAASTNANPLVLTMDQARSVTAVFVLDTVPLSIAGSPANYGSPAPLGYGTNLVLRNTVITNRVSSPVQIGGGIYNCTGWSGTGNVPASGVTTQTVFTLTGNSSLLWNWQAAQYQLSISVSGTGTLNATNGYYAAGSNVLVTATPGPNYRFSGWSGNVPAGMTTANPLNLPMDQPRTITALVVLDTLPFTVTSSPAGFGAPSPNSFGTAFYLRGSTVTNRAGAMNPLNGTLYVCTGWVGSGSVPLSGVSTQVVFTLTTNSAVIWQWQASAYQFMTSIAGRGAVSLTNNWVTIGATVTNTATPQPGHRFARWFGDVPAGAETNNPLVVTMSQPRNMTAYFVPDGTGTMSLTGDWPTFGNGPGHTGYFPGTVGATNQFTNRWNAVIGGSLQQIAIGGGRIYVTPYQYFGTAFLQALNAFSGQLLWNHTFQSCYSINPPTYDSGAVFVQRGDNGGDTELWSFDVATGNVNWSAPHAAQWERYLAPTIVNGRIYVDGGTYGGMYGFNETNGAQTFFQGLDQYDGWTPTYYNNKIYSWMAGNFREHDPVSGATLWSTNVGWNWSGYTMNRTVAAVDGRAHFVGNSGLYTLDLNSHQMLWTLSTGFTGTPAAANGVLCAISNNTVQIFLAGSGQYLGACQSLDGAALINQPIITDDAIIVASSSATYIFNLGGFGLRQTLPAGGYCSLANGILYVADSSGTLHAYYAGPDNQLVVQSNAGTRGNPSPIYGTNIVPQGFALTAALNAPVTISNGLRYAIGGWAGTGSVPSSGATNSFSFTITNDSVLTWLWSTQCSLTISVGNNGTVDATSGWYNFGAKLPVTAFPSNYFHFAGWSGSTNTSANPVTVMLSTPQTLAAAFAPDMTTNGVPAWWLAQNGIAPTIAGALADSDNDGAANWQEFFAGTDPNNPNSVLKITATDRPAPGQFRMRWQSVAGKTYRLWCATSINQSPYNLLATNIAAVPPQNTFIDSVGSKTKAFYFIQVEP